MIDLSTLRLKSGSHKRRDEGVCVMEAVAWFAGLDHSDTPTCTDVVVAAYARALNDRMSDTQRQRLVPFIPRLAGTKNGVAGAVRGYLCAAWAVRVFAPIALVRAGQHDAAARLRALPEVVDKQTADAANAAADYAAAWDESLRLLDTLIEVGR